LDVPLESEYILSEVYRVLSRVDDGISVVVVVVGGRPDRFLSFTG